MKMITTFATRTQYEKALATVKALNVTWETIDPTTVFCCINAPAIILDAHAQTNLLQSAPGAFTCSGWIEYRAAGDGLCRPQIARDTQEEVFGNASVMVLAPCIADLSKIRLIAHISGNIAEALPYLAAQIPGAFFNPAGPTLTYMDGYRMIALYDRRVSVAKADETVDGWRVIETVRQRVNDAWARRDAIQPCTEARRKPSALEIYNRLPKINCGGCGEKACMAFALQLWSGKTTPDKCTAFNEPQFVALKGAFEQICAALGFMPAEEKVGN